ncbi:MAG: CDP-diacylglycerol--glycerol-3-phosphate 3-phosphatidyltransferase [Candidatus Acetothermia bacterium]|jgi:CDP-diacylglycerol--glycerol-3-phosphate 3-phosphatidyltransferase|nr:CDP-diacylglycerol--glycerol-3-phosphate 3-phosphatidyltransferase [Candidatus Acetothermia bacterium]MDH7505327.1 CDP-diacylglycerol--glycerol-3-phosphate 3-phosphatidyltransferase [Candidatus Acetothermia bacterium]
MALNLPNRLTLLRIAVIPLLMTFILIPPPWGKIVAIFIFALAALSDAVDGYIARNWRQVTDFGKFADPIADKLLIASALLSFMQLGEFGGWGAAIVMTILAREFLVTGLRILTVSQDLVIRASALGKLKTLSHIGLVFTILGNSYFHWGGAGEVAKDLFIGLALFLAVISGVDYFYRSRGLFRRI